MNSIFLPFMQIFWLMMVLAANINQAAAQTQLPGRLFSTPTERQLLDQMRRRGDMGQAPVEEVRAEMSIIEAEDITRPPPPDNIELRFSGSVARGNGSYALWLNDEAINEQSLPAGITLVQHGHITALQIARGNSSFLVLPGQRFHLASGVISNIFPTSVDVVPATADSEPSTDSANDPGEQEPANDTAVLATLRLIMEYME